MHRISRSLPWMQGVAQFFKSVPLGLIGLYFLVTRLLIILLGALSVQIIQQGKFDRSGHLINMFNHWDAGWYQNIAVNGYQYSATEKSQAAFFPFYPILVHLGNFIFHDTRLAGYFISNVCLFASCLILWQLVARDYGNKAAADRAVLFLLLCPVSFFYSTIFSESTFFLLFVLVAYFAAERRWLAAGFCGYFLTLTRAPGILVVILLAAEFAMQLYHRSRDKGWRVAIPAYLREEGISFLSGVLLLTSGLGTFCLYLGYKFHDPLAFQAAQSTWGRHIVVPWFYWDYNSVTHIPFYTLWFDNAFVLAFVFLALGLFLRIRPSHWLIAAVFVTLYLSSSIMESLPRLMSIIFPFYIIAALAATRWPRLEPLLFGGSAMLLMLSTILFVNGYWFT